MGTKQHLRRSNKGINAGSMADIAFLLLIFFLVTTTMDTDAGIQRILPAITEETEPEHVPRRNVLEVLVNDAGELLVGGQPLEVHELRAVAQEFLLNTDQRDDLPLRRLVTQAGLRESISEAEAELAALTQEDLRMRKQQSIDRLHEKLAAVQLLGDITELPASAQISLRTGALTTYDRYVQVQNELEAAVRELRDELALRKTGRKFTELNEHDPNDRALIKAIRLVHPQRISEVYQK